MLIHNSLAAHHGPLDQADADAFGEAGAGEVQRFLAHREDHAPTPLVHLPSLAASLGVASLHVKDEGHRLGLGSFKALGGAYAVVRLVLEVASQRLGRAVDVAEWRGPAVAELGFMFVQAPAAAPACLTSCFRRCACFLDSAEPLPFADLRPP